jgi:hypothetical protein
MDYRPISTDTSSRLLQGSSVDYFDIDGLLASEEEVSVSFLEDVPNLGWLDKSGQLDSNGPVCSNISFLTSDFARVQSFCSLVAGKDMGRSRTCGNREISLSRR